VTENSQKREIFRQTTQIREAGKHLKVTRDPNRLRTLKKKTGIQAKQKSPNKTLERLPSGVTNSVMGKNPPNLGLATRQSLDTLKDRNASILPQIQQKPNDS
jgi:ABC-type transporter Mla subunit MlaD